MLYPRCRGLLVYDHFSDLREEAGSMCAAARCINCGNIEDSAVRFNRLHPPAAKRAIARGMVRNVVLLRPQSRGIARCDLTALWRLCAAVGYPLA
jgi:hypothetical protein